MACISIWPNELELFTPWLALLIIVLIVCNLPSLRRSDLPAAGDSLSEPWMFPFDGRKARPVFSAVQIRCAGGACSFRSGRAARGPVPVAEDIEGQFFHL
jgi:hypothetical protein